MDRWMLKNKINVIVEAVQLTSENIQEIAEWTQGKIVEERDSITNRMYDGLNILTIAGYKRLSLGMYVVKFNGNFYVARRHVFEKQYSRLPAKAAQVENPRDAKIIGMGKFAGPPWFDGRKE